jgi:hypothetical protein
MRILFALLISTSICHAQAQSAPVGYRVQQSIAVQRGAGNARVELLEDARLTAAARPAIVDAYTRGEPPCTTHVPETTELCAAPQRHPVRMAAVRLVGPTGNELSRLTLERATAELSRLAVSRRDSVIAVRVDLSADAGSYSGPIVRFLDVSGPLLAWTQVLSDSTGRSSDLVLPTTLKTGWRADNTSDDPKIFLVACRPDFDRPSSTDRDVAFAITYSRLYRTNGQWHRVDRRVPGFWESDGPFPAGSLFP